jgi:hypothetical protein
MKKPGESLYDYVTRRVTEEGPQTDEQAEAGFIDGNVGHDGEGVTIMLGTGKRQLKKPDKSVTDPIRGKKQGPAGTKPELMPFVEMTERDRGIGFIIGLGANTPTPIRGGGKTKIK